jgi:hypothetical protein
LTEDLVSTAPDRDGSRARDQRPKRLPPDERPVLRTRPARVEAEQAKPVTAAAAGAGGDGMDKTSWSKAVVVLNAVLIVVVAIVGIRYTQGRGDDTAGDQATEVAPQTASSLPESTGTASTTPSTSPSSSPSSTPSSAGTASQGAVTQAGTATAADVPKVAKKLSTDFAAGDPWPTGADPWAVGSRAWKLGPVGGELTHGAPTGGLAASWIQKWTETDVRRIGARVEFAPNHSGSIALTAFFDTIRGTTGSALPQTGMRLVATPTSWQLVTIGAKGKESVLVQGTYTLPGTTATYDLVRRADTLWLTTPDGVVHVVQDPRIAELSGPWADWELRESGKAERPAGFKAIWAG